MIPAPSHPSPALPLRFERPAALEAAAPPEARGLARDGVRLLVSDAGGHRLSAFRDLPALLRPGDLLVVNRSATLPAALDAGFRDADGRARPVLLHLSNDYGPGPTGHAWLVEPRLGPDRPGPVDLTVGDSATAGGLEVTLLEPHPGLPRLRFALFAGDPRAALLRAGRPIRYGHVEPRPLADLQTVFADRPGSAEMPSAGRPFTPRVLAALAARGVALARVTLHAGVASLEAEDAGDGRGGFTLYAEAFEVPLEAVRAVEAARTRGGRVIAVGTTVVRALESAAGDDGRLRPARGATRRVVRPGAFRGSVDGLLTGLHDPGATHLAMLEAVAGRAMVEGAYREALQAGMLWHEFGDSHLLLPERSGM